MNDSEKRLTVIEVNMTHISNSVKELAEVTKNGMRDFTTIINNHVADDLREHKELRNLIQKNKDFRHKVIWTLSGATFVITVIIGSYKLFF